MRVGGVRCTSTDKDDECEQVARWLAAGPVAGCHHQVLTQAAHGASQVHQHMEQPAKHCTTLHPPLRSSCIFVTLSPSP